jgi:hypothetical protein
MVGYIFEEESEFSASSNCVLTNPFQTEFNLENKFPHLYVLLL